LAVRSAGVCGVHIFTFEFLILNLPAPPRLCVKSIAKNDFIAPHPKKIFISD